MTTFNLPDLGEGLPEAEIVEWLVKEGDHVTVDQPMASVETAKAVVEVPSPYTGAILRLHAKPGDIVRTGMPLVDFELASSADEAGSAGDSPHQSGVSADESRVPSPESRSEGMVVGRMRSSTAEFVDTAIAGRSRRRVRERVRAAPAVRMLAKKLGVDLATCRATDKRGLISVDDVLAAADVGGARGGSPRVPGLTDADRLRGPRKAMAHSMSVSRDAVAMCTIFDDADIECWTRRGDITIRLVRAIVAGVNVEPGLNALFDPQGPSRKLLDQVDLAIAMDTPEGLIVPVVRNAGAQSPAQLRDTLNSLKQRTRDRTITPEEMRGCSFTLSNFGTLAGRYATPLVTPPTVAILGAGKLQRDVVAGAEAPEIHVRLPLSLTFDHRCITGGEACRFLAAVIADLHKPD